MCELDDSIFVANAQVWYTGQIKLTDTNPELKTFKADSHGYNRITWYNGSSYLD